jgi:preprotein translocase subunit SecD
MTRHQKAVPQIPRGDRAEGVTWGEVGVSNGTEEGIVIRIALVAATGFAAIAPFTASADEQSRRAVVPATELAAFEVNTDRIQTTLLEVRLAETEPATGLDAATVPGSNNKIYMHDQRVITNNDVVQARVVEGKGQFSIAITLTASGAARMASATAKHVGKPLAIIVNGDVIAAPTVRAQIGSEAMITGDFTLVEAERIAAGLRR